MACLALDLAGLKVSLALRANFNPAQVRIPRGQPGGGRWAGGDDGGLVPASSVARRRSATVRVGRRWLEATPDQALRLSLADASARSAVARARELDPTFQPAPSFTETVEGEITARLAEAREAEARIREIIGGGYGGNSGETVRSTPDPAAIISAYRFRTGMPETVDGVARSLKEGTVAFATVNGRAFVGVNSSAPSYTADDDRVATEMRSRLVERYPEVMSTANVGAMPNDALFHAEATALLRAAQANGGSLTGRTIEIQVDRPMCDRCDMILPYVGLQLGNPLVIIRDPTGKPLVMRNGSWR